MIDPYQQVVNTPWQTMVDVQQQRMQAANGGDVTPPRADRQQVASPASSVSSACLAEHSAMMSSGPGQVVVANTPQELQQLQQMMMNGTVFRVDPMAMQAMPAMPFGPMASAGYGPIVSGMSCRANPTNSFLPADIPIQMLRPGGSVSSR